MIGEQIERAVKAAERLSIALCMHSVAFAAQCIDSDSAEGGSDDVMRSGPVGPVRSVTISGNGTVIKRHAKLATFNSAVRWYPLLLPLFRKWCQIFGNHARL